MSSALKYPAVTTPERFTGAAAIARIQGVLAREGWHDFGLVFDRIMLDFPDHPQPEMREEFLAAIEALERERYLEIRNTGQPFYGLQVKKV